jgi:hypothetical protein
MYLGFDKSQNGKGSLLLIKGRLYRLDVGLIRNIKCLKREDNENTATFDTEEKLEDYMKNYL